MLGHAIRPRRRTRVAGSRGRETQLLVQGSLERSTAEPVGDGVVRHEQDVDAVRAMLGAGYQHAKSPDGFVFGIVEELLVCKADLLAYVGFFGLAVGGFVGV